MNERKHRITSVLTDLSAKNSTQLFVLILAIYAAVFYFFWGGVGPGDAKGYIAAALEWAEAGPNLGDNHWALRYPLVLPMAALFSFGPSEFAATAPNFLYGALLIAVTFYLGRHFLGRDVAAIAAILVATSSFFTIQSGEIRIYGVEIFFVVTSLWILLNSIDGGAAKLDRLFLAGLFAGGAWLCRESTIFLPITIGAVILFSSAPFLRASVAAAAGFLIILGSELLLYGIFANDPFYRYKIDLGHGGDNPSTQLGGPTANQTFLEYLAHPFVEIFSYPSVTPIVLAGIAAAVFIVRTANTSDAVMRPFVVFSLASALSFLICAYALSLEYAIYYPVVAYTAILATAFAIKEIYLRGARLIALAIGMGVVVTGFAAADFRDYDEYSEARLLADLVEEHREPIFSDRLTSSRASTILRLRGYSKSETLHFLPVDGVPTYNMLVYRATPKGVRYQLSASGNWVEVDKRSPRDASWTKSLIKAVVPSSLHPPRLREILQRPNPVILYRNVDAQNVENDQSAKPDDAEK